MATHSRYGHGAAFGWLAWGVLLLAPVPVAARTLSPAQGFFDSLAAHCGKAYAGVIEKNEPADPADPFIGKSLVMHVRECADRVIRVPFHVGEDHSRTWVLTLVHDTQLQLQHDHRHADGSPDVLTLYGGSTAEAGDYRRQAFPVDAGSKALFTAQGREVSNSNTWALELDERHFVYELSRPGGRLFRVRFDLGRPVAAPPPPWGAAPDAGRADAAEGH